MTTHLLTVADTLTVALVDATPPQVSRARATTGARDGGAGQPSLVVRFVEGLTSAIPNRQGLTHTGWTGDDFYLLERSTGRPLVRFPFGELGEVTELRCDASVRKVPHLAELVRLKLLAQDIAPLHGSAALHGELGVVVMGWAKCGKTAAMLALARLGAAFVGEEWVALAPADNRVYALGRTLEVSHRHIHHFPRAAARAGFARRGAWQAFRLLERHPPAPLRDSLARVGDRLSTRLPPDAIFDTPSVEGSVDPDVLVLAQNRAVDRPVLRAASGAGLADRMAAVGRFERSSVRGLYEAFRYAFPGRCDSLLDEADERELALLRSAFAGRDVHLLTHRHPGPLGPLQEVLEVLFD